MLEILLATTLVLATLTVIVRPKTDTANGTGIARDLMAGPSRDKWDLAAHELTDIGAVVAPYNDWHPNMMAVHLKPGVVLTKNMAQETAQCAHSMLGHRSLVTLRDASGKVIAIATE